MIADVFPVDERTFCVDGFDMGTAKRTGSYVLDERPHGVALIETGPSISIPYIKHALKSKGITPDEIKYIIVTHIHLDHAGGAGLLLKECPKAKVIVHPAGKRHLENPERLIQGAKAIYGAQFNDFFEPVLPVPGPALMEMKNKSTLTLSPGRKLTFYHTPGHARHHFSIMDSRTNTFFTGDTLGIRYPQLEESGVHLFLPSTSPNQFDPDAMLNSVSLAENLQPDRIAFGHFFISEEPAKVYRDINKWLPVFIEKGKYVLKKNQDWNALKEILLAEVKRELDEFGIPEDDPVYEVIQLDLTVSSLGIVDYLTKQKI